ncbi:hypothetical protein [Streptomyces violaceusniger]|uniref:Luciferase-like domain-containing protein n=1 Tax=Streptomyces violaceusniger TaxID=68280 RepID=A0A4D4LJU7_STRVO|nr:hypothetical protein SVIO_089560 [Streptomyces violaceusniger]
MRSEWDFNGVRSRLRDPGPGVPIHVAASGPRNLRLAGEIAERLAALHADGVTDVFLQHVGSYDPPTELIESVGSAVLPVLRPEVSR